MATRLTDSRPCSALARRAFKIKQRPAARARAAGSLGAHRSLHACRAEVSSSRWPSLLDETACKRGPYWIRPGLPPLLRARQGLRRSRRSSAVRRYRRVARLGPNRGGRALRGRLDLARRPRHPLLPLFLIVMPSLPALFSNRRKRERTALWTRDPSNSCGSWFPPWSWESPISCKHEASLIRRRETRGHVTRTEGFQNKE